MHLWEFLREFAEALEAHLRSNADGWDDDWLRLTRDGQERRAWDAFQQEFAKFFEGGGPIDWLEVAGIAFVCWLRERHPGPGMGDHVQG